MSADTDNATFLAAALGPELARQLTQPLHLAQARAAFTALTSGDSPGIARAWFHGMNPQLDDANPLQAINAGHGDAVIIAARNHARGDNAN
ncbi:hypothetical protein [Streptomyces nigrescens]|uniref:hypothetical protein n=1 Tax=Streptomyces nigrescens TaxID=1920 RepID=UPI0036FB01F9